MTIKGYSTHKKADTDQNQFGTVNRVREGQFGLDVVAHAFVQSAATDTAETGSTTQIIKATAHSALVGDLISWTAGNLNTREYRVESLPDADHIKVSEVMAAAPANGDAFTILRQKAALVNADGSLAVSVPAPVGGATSAKQDTGNTSLASIDGKLPATLGPKAKASAMAVTLATDEPALPISGTVSLGAGSALVGSVSIDQTTPGTTNAVKATNFPTTVDTNSGAAGASTPRAVLATRHEAVATPLAVQLSTGTAAIAYGTGADGATVPRHTLSTRHEAAATPVSVRATDGSAFFDPPGKGKAYADSIRYTYVTAAVGTVSWVQLIASTAADINALFIFDSSGQTLELGTGGAGSESRKLIIPPGGLDGPVPLRIPSGTRVAIRALSATTGAIGEINITGLT